MIIFAFKKGELKEKTQNVNFSLPIKNPESAFNKLIRIPKLAQILGGFRIRIANPRYNT